MPYNGSGTYAAPASSWNPVTTGTAINSTDWKALLADVTTALSTCLLKDGQQTPTANIGMGGFKLTGLGAGSAAGNSVRYEQVFTSQALTDGATINWDTSTAPMATVTLGGNRTMAAPTNMKAGGRYELAVTQDGTGGRTLTWNSVFKGQGGGIMPQPEGTAAAVTVFRFFSDGTNLYTEAQTPFMDTNYFVRGATDPTKKVRMEVDALTTATERTITMVDDNVDLQYARAASTTIAGGIEIATQAEVNAMTDTSRALTPNLNKIVLSTPVASTSGTSIDFTSIPAGVRRINVAFNGVSSTGTSQFMIQIGDSGGVETTGYVSSAFNISAQSDFTAGFGLMTGSTAALAYYGSVTLILMDSSTNTWVSQGAIGASGSGNAWASSGGKALSAELDRVRITTLTGTDTFDAGSINVTYER